MSMKSRIFAWKRIAIAASCITSPALLPTIETPSTPALAAFPARACDILIPALQSFTQAASTASNSALYSLGRRVKR